MRNLVSITTAAIFLMLGASSALAQPAGAPPKDASTSTIVTKMMAFDKNKDGKLTKDEITDPRLVRLFDQADTDKDGVVTKEELNALAATLEAEIPAGGRGARGGGPGGPDGGGPGGPRDGGPDGGGPGGPGAGGPGGGGPGGGRGPGGRGAPGQILPPMLQDALNLTADQKKQLADLQKEVDTKLAKILTQEQLTQMKQMRQRGPGGGPGGGGPGGQGGPNNGGPGGGGRPPR